MCNRQDLSELPGHVIRRLNQRSTAIFQERVKATRYGDMTSVQFAALDILDRNPGIDQAGLAQQIAYDRATIGGVIKRLERKGFVERQVDEKDRRARNLQLTTRGRAALELLTPVVARMQSDILGNLDKSERAVFMALSRKAVAL